MQKNEITNENERLLQLVVTLRKTNDLLEDNSRTLWFINSVIKQKIDFVEKNYPAVYDKLPFNYSLAANAVNVKELDLTLFN